MQMNCKNEKTNENLESNFVLNAIHFESEIFKEKTE